MLQFLGCNFCFFCDGNSSSLPSDPDIRLQSAIRSWYCKTCPLIWNLILNSRPLALAHHKIISTPLTTPRKARPQIKFCQIRFWDFLVKGITFSAKHGFGKPRPVSVKGCVFKINRRKLNHSFKPLKLHALRPFEKAFRLFKIDRQSIKEGSFRKVVVGVGDQGKRIQAARTNF